MTDAALALQKALYAALTAHTPLTALLGGAHVYDAVPHSQPFPYLTFASLEAKPWNTATSIGAEHTLTLEAYSEAKGRRAALEIIAAAEAALAAPLSVDGHAVILVKSERLNARRAADGRVFQASLQVKVVMEAV